LPSVAVRGSSRCPAPLSAAPSRYSPAARAARSPPHRPAPERRSGSRPGGAEPSEPPQLRLLEAFPARIDDRDVICLRDPSGVSESVLTVPRALAPILALFDGLRTLVDVQAEVMRQCGELILRSQLESMVEVLDQHFFLECPRL